MGFGQSDGRIYQNAQYGGLLKRWNDEDEWSKLTPITNSFPGMIFDAETCTIKPVKPRAIQAETPWSHVKHACGKRCGLDHYILFNIYGVIPPRCQECWKIVVAPRTFDELIKLEALETALDRPSKCGIELRDYTPRHYGGYFYTNSLDEGRARYEEVRKAVDEQLSPDINIILKRACTEFEMLKGPSHLWNLSKHDEAIIEVVEHYVNMDNVMYDQAQMLKPYIRLRWALWAHMNGDMSYQKYNDGLPLFPSCLEYHEGEAQDHKHDQALGRVEAEFGIDPNLTDDFWTTSLKWASENNVDPNALTKMLGGMHSNKMNLQPETPAEAVIGGHDELT